MARKKKEKKPKAETQPMGWDKEDKEEALEAEGLKRIDMDVGRVELLDRDTSTPFIETYDEETGELEGKILLKDGNREGLLALVKIIEEVNVDQDHFANLNSINFSGKLNVENPSKVDRLWDIDLSLDNIGSTNLKSSEIKIQELGVTEEDSIDSRAFKIKGEVTNQLLIKEYINTLPEADNVLNFSDIETDLLKLKDKTSKAGTITQKPKPDEEEEEDEDETMGDGGVDIDEYSLESFGISIDKENTVSFAIAMRSLFEKPIQNLKIIKNIPNELKNTIVRDSSLGTAQLEGNQLIWTIDKLEPETTVILKFSCEITVSTIDAIKTGAIEVSFQAASSFAGGLGIGKFDAYTTNKFYVDELERDEEPNVWDCKLVFDNSSEFIVELFNADVYASEDESKKFIDIDPNDVPRLPSGAQWHSIMWLYESEDYPSFRKKLEFRVMPDFQTMVNGTIAISDVELSVASITGEMSYDITQVPTFTEKDVNAVLKIENNGSAPLNEVSIVQQYFSEEYQPPKADEIKLIWDGSEVELASKAVSVEDNSFKIALTDLKDSSTGMFEPKSILEVQYPIHAVNPAKDARFESEIIYYANIFPRSQELEFRPEVPVLEALHLRRKFRIGKEVQPIGDLGNYKIILLIENIGDMALQNLTLMDKVPDSFEYGSYSTEPEITDEVGQDTLKWEIEKLEEGEKLEISYEITGKGKYSPSDAQLAL